MTPIDFAALNAAFQALSPAEKRRAIARDVIARLNAGRLIPHLGDWIKTIYHTHDVQAAINDPDAAPCQACALGAAAMGLAHFEDALTFVSDYRFWGGKRLDISDSGAADRLIALFGIPQLILIERCYEGTPVFHMETPGGRASTTGGDAHLTIDILDAAEAFRAKRLDKDAAFRAIWTDIAQDPEGRFDPVRALENRP